ncbi:ATP-binding protein [Kineococcus gypseus]|uniref:ATP-binding protein n=1 Tax=Kineococcus gypseus TaxID=1637102 RepID=UPI003D7D214A
MPDADHVLRLQPDAGSAARARGHVRRVLGPAVPGAVVDDAEVCASELVTNAVLHAGGPVVLTVHRTGDAVRLEVADPSPVAPQWVPRSLTAATGRGLRLITALSAARGTEVHPDGSGKSVWCELSSAAPPAGRDEEREREEQGHVDALMAAEWASAVAELSAGGAGDGAPAPAGAEPLRLLRYPLRRGVRLREHREAMLRELRLLDLAHAFPDAATAALAHDVTDLLDSEYGGHLNGAETRKLAALADGLDSVDLEYPRASYELERVTRWRARMAEAERVGRSLGLLTLSEVPDVEELSHWMGEEFERQLRGGRPRPWDGPLD